MAMEKRQLQEDLARANSKVTTVESGQITTGENFEVATRQLDRLRAELEALKVTLETVKLGERPT